MKGRVILKSGKDFHGVMLWSFQVEGSRRFWRCGRVEPAIEEGQCIEFQHDEAGNVDTESIVLAETAPSTSETTRPTSGTGGAVDVGTRMRYQAARADACRLVIAALHTDHLPHAANVTKAKRLPLLEGYVEQVTKTFLEQEEKNVCRQRR
jgi:hypothetical protein